MFQLSNKGGEHAAPYTCSSSSHVLTVLGMIKAEVSGKLLNVFIHYLQRHSGEGISTSDSKSVGLLCNHRFACESISTEENKAQAKLSDVSDVPHDFNGI